MRHFSKLRIDPTMHSSCHRAYSVPAMLFSIYVSPSCDLIVLRDMTANASKRSDALGCTDAEWGIYLYTSDTLPHAQTASYCPGMW